MFGAYLWSYNVRRKEVEIDVHLYKSAALNLDIIPGGKVCYLRQETD
jgi:hypothetical protein